MNVAERVTRGAAPRSLMVARCLGSFRLEDGLGKPLQIRTRKARALLAVLSLQARPMSRDALADLLWSDRGQAQARSSLRQTIFELQHLEPRGGSLLMASRDGVTAGREALVTDLELIRTAAASGEWQRLLALLESSDAGLLTDLDGLDPELDDWLRLHRAHEPGKTFTAALEAADRCAAEVGPRPAQDIVDEILRLEPVNEAARRLAMRIAHQLGDRVALHRHFEALCDGLRDDYGAEPSPETVELFGLLSDAPGPSRPPPPPRTPEATIANRPQASGWRRQRAAAFVLAAALGILAILLSRERREAAPGSAPVMVAVLPFEPGSTGDAWLAGGLWDDTRAVLSRNPGLRVLGRATTRAVSGQKLMPGDYRKRLGVDYLLEGSVRRSGDQVLVSVALTRTSDGIAIWEDSFRARLGDPIALQEAIATGIEGKLRGRLARGGGRRADQIATTSEVYALYSEARTLIRDREIAQVRRAEGLLRRAVALDPNYAPAWAALAEATYFGTNIGGAARRDEMALGYVRRALALAPSLAPAYAVKAKLIGEGSAVAEKALERAVELDPGYTEAWLWLGNIRNRQYRIRDAALAYERAAEIDPLWAPAAENAAHSLAELGDWEGWSRRVERTRRAGADEELLVTLGLYQPLMRGDYSTALAAVLAFRRKHPGRPLTAALRDAVELLARLGYADEAAELDGSPAWLPGVIRSQRVAPADYFGDRVEPRDLWTHPAYAAATTRAMINLGRTADVIRAYRAAFPSREHFVASLDQGGQLLFVAPTLAVALRAHGLDADADSILAAAARPLEKALPWRGQSRYLEWELARIRAAQGREAAALELLRQSVLERGWLPTGMEYPLDLNAEPAFRSLHRNARFQVLRKRILDHIARERAELGPLKI